MKFDDSDEYWLFAENLTACITDSPEIKNPIRIHK
jgi:hypothetical protein